MKQFIVDRHTTPNTPTLEQVPTEKIPIYENRAAVTADLANLSVGQIVATKDTGDELAQPVNVVESGNLHAVSSNAVAEEIATIKAGLGWTTLANLSAGTAKNDIAESTLLQYDEILLVIMNSADSVLASCTYPTKMLSLRTVSTFECEYPSQPGNYKCRIYRTGTPNMWGCSATGGYGLLFGRKLS